MATETKTKTQSTDALARNGNSARPGEILISADGHRALEARLVRLRAARETEYAERFREVRGYGDAGANDEYLAILEDEAVIDLQIARLEALLARARIVNESDAREGVATIGTTVVPEDQDTLATERFRLVGSLETGGAGTITTSSPVGRALMGREVGDLVNVELPSGAVRELRIRAIETRPLPKQRANR